MRVNKEYSIPFSGLKEGKHRFTYTLSRAFFDSFDYHEFNEANINVTVELDRRSTVLELEMEANGSVNVLCDLSREPYDQPLQSTLKLVVKFGEEYNDEDDEILILPHGEHQINIAQYLYEMTVLAVPAKRVHPGVLDGSLKSELLEKLEELQPGEIKQPNEETDPRWDALRKFLNG